MPRLPGRRRSDLAVVIRSALLIALGQRCQGCGGTLLSVLEIDHVDGRAWSLRGTDSLERALRYCQEYRDGVHLRVLCRRCNARDGARRGNSHIPDPPSYPTACEACGRIGADCRCRVPF